MCLYNYNFRGTKATFYEGGVHVLAFVGGGYVPKSQRGTQRNGLMHGSDWLPTIVGLATTNDNGNNSVYNARVGNNIDIATILNDLQERLYIPVAKRVALKRENSTDNYFKYLVDESFDGIDLSQWLLYGNNSANPRRNVGLSINSLVPLNESVSIVFDSEITNHRYKFIYLPNSRVQNGDYCIFCDYGDSDSREACQLHVPLTDSKLMFDLTIDANETSNLITDSTGSSSIHIHSTQHLQMLNRNFSDVDIDHHNTNKIERITDHKSNVNYELKFSNNYDYQINDLSDYKKKVNEELIQLLWTEAEIIIYEYQQNALFNNYLSCQHESFSEANPGNFGDAYSPFFSWQEYQISFEEICGDYINDVLLEMYLSYYGEY